MKEKLFYCKKCGTQHQMFECSDYDPETGKKVQRQACPKVGCVKNCDFFEHEWDRKWFGNWKCKKCGEVEMDYY